MSSIEEYMSQYLALSVPYFDFNEFYMLCEKEKIRVEREKEKILGLPLYNYMDSKTANDTKTAKDSKDDIVYVHNERERESLLSSLNSRLDSEVFELLNSLSDYLSFREWVLAYRQKGHWDKLGLNIKTVPVSP
jgi:hypothetical protein